jgi:hypothetical protein
MLNQFAWPVSMDKIGWKTYIIFTIWCGVQSVVIYFWIPETKNRTVSSPIYPHYLQTRKETNKLPARRTRRNLQLTKSRASLDGKKETRIRRLRRSRQYPRDLISLCVSLSLFFFFAFDGDIHVCMLGLEYMIPGLDK